ncbi:hypothetical protein [Nocardia sp. NPDC020380]|uniref:MmyB family transcriptional regulator n=1 Tax=Nocardia sp. NPDC020380 TaxID=3364309 RepID=UPI0037AC6DBA
MFDPSAPPAADLAVLHSLPHPACLHDAAFDVVAANRAFVEIFPGTGAGANLMTGIMLDPMARYRLGDWEFEAQLMVSTFRHLAPGRVAPARIEEILNLCRRSPEWDRLWNENEGAEAPRERTVLMHEPETRREIRLYVQTFLFESPQRPWWLLTLVPFE